MPHPNTCWLRHWQEVCIRPGECRSDVGVEAHRHCVDVHAGARNGRRARCPCHGRVGVLATAIDATGAARMRPVGLVVIPARSKQVATSFVRHDRWTSFEKTSECEWACASSPTSAADAWACRFFGRIGEDVFAIRSHHMQTKRIYSLEMGLMWIRTTTPPSVYG
jgi:hypothetical protein